MHRLTSKKYLRIAGIVLGVLVLIGVIAGYVAYTKRSALLQKAIYKATAKAKRDHNLDVKIGSAQFTGLSTVAFHDITVVPFQRDTLFHINDLSVSVKLMPLVLGEVKLSDVILKDGFLSLISKNGVRNFDFLFRKKKDSTSTKSTSGLNEFADNLINEVLYKIPDNLDLRNFRITFADDSNQVKLMARKARIYDGDLTSTIEVNDRESVWHFAGKMHPSDKEIDVKLYADGKKVELPLIEKKFKLKFNFDTLTTRLNKVEHGSNETQVYTYCSVKNLLVNHPALSARDVVVPDGSIDANVFVGDKYVALDSSSVIHLKKLNIHPYLKYKIRPVKMYTLKVHTDWQDAQDFFDSFPQGLFESLEGIQVAGKLRYNAHLFLDTSNPDDVQFESGLAKQDFRILKFGKVDLGRLNREFVYTPYEKGKPMPPRTIGPSNPNYTPITEISPNLRYAVMTAEDPSFLTNNGFVQESLRKSIAEDFKEKRFKRGGSTISMQLVKNAFLVRQKTLTRKFEEILIVWLIQNGRIMTKDRMLEVYFNIIEWGRNIYGIGEASRYYFAKSPAELTLGESIYLASIVPNPKNGLYAFEPDGSLRYRLHGYFRLIGNLMAKRGWTQPDSSAYGFYSVRLKESLRPKMPITDTAAVDSLLQNNPDDEGAGGMMLPGEAQQTKEEDRPGFFKRLFGGGKKDSTDRKKEALADSADAAKKRERDAKREQKRLDKERRKELRERGLL
ncbi:transglycosylase domain-containing protein [Mucilaginibacter daejeonensis]|uniref:transglycosylase domain-containing protein n=1 Tax=Mucilaginibacter daejeonensis TaxID=398049 RepID=UPI001D17D036|nr:biosynthetic peptidoglycan transglycosylase [Mucilaginibacter daejeonensis]UEG53475.1 transglycosylase domain-containing protein [Mucilaginibacter daejeonensis]